jgi:NADPH:quinone reductase-like Zn-dependent oxidoreductase
MLAAVATGVNDREPLSSLALATLPVPEAGPGRVRIKVAASSVNMHDLWTLRGVGAPPSGFPRVLGCDVVGWDPAGNEVLVTSAFGDVDAGGGDETFDPRRTLISEELPGAFAAYTVVPARNVIPKPSWLTFDEAACLGVAWGTTYRALFTRARALPGESVLVQGAGGGVSTAAIAMARAAGLHVVVTSRSAAKRRRALELGAHEAHPTGTRLANPVDLVVDTVGAATWAHSLRSLRPGGRIVTSGATTGGDCPSDLARVFYKQLSIIGSTAATRAETVRMLQFLRAAGVRPVIDSVHPLDRIHDAFARAQAPDLFGKVVVRVASAP